MTMYDDGILSWYCDLLFGKHAPLMRVALQSVKPRPLARRRVKAG